MQQQTERQQLDAQQIALNTEQISLNRQNIQFLTASRQELRNLVADSIQGRTQTP